MPKMILFRGGVETLTYFSRQIGAYFKEKGYSLFWFDLENAKECGRKVKKFINSDTILVTFNFLGLSGEEGCYEEHSGYVWEQYQVPCINIVVDHPLYYAERYVQLPKRYYQISIDRKHRQYMKDYYKDIQADFFLPLAGNVRECPDIQPEHGKTVNTQTDTVKSSRFDTSLYFAKPQGFEEEFGSVKEWLSSRPLDIMFAGNYQYPEQYEPYITRINEEYAAFYREIIHNLFSHPECSLEEIAKPICIREMGNMTAEQWQVCFQHFNFIDLYVRFAVRKEVLKVLLESGLTLDVYGHGYEHFTYDGFDEEAAKRLRIHGPLTTSGCLEAMRKTKISVNVMPWFKDGAHDRIFSSMLMGSVSASDDSIYLREQLTDGKEVIFYGINEIAGLSGKIAECLAHPDNMYEMARQGYECAVKKHTWNQRAQMLESYFTSLPFPKQS